MSNIKHIIENYLRVIDIEEPVLYEILDSLEKHPGYPSIKSLAETLEEWELKFNIVSGEKEDLVSLGDFFIAVHKGTYVFVTKTEQEEIIYLNDKGFIIKEPYEVFDSGWNKMAFWVDKPKYPVIHKIIPDEYMHSDRANFKQYKDCFFWTNRAVYLSILPTIFHIFYLFIRAAQDQTRYNYYSLDIDIATSVLFIGFWLGKNFDTVSVVVPNFSAFYMGLYRWRSSENHKPSLQKWLLFRKSNALDHQYDNYSWNLIRTI